MMTLENRVALAKVGALSLVALMVVGCAPHQHGAANIAERDGLPANVANPGTRADYRAPESGAPTPSTYAGSGQNYAGYPGAAQASGGTLGPAEWASAYAAVEDGGFYLPAIPWQKVPENYRRQVVSNYTGEPPGKIVVDTKNNYLFYTMPNGLAMRYGVGLGRAGFEWSGKGEVKVKRQWPRWHPPEEMIEREPYLKRYTTTFNSRTGRWEGGMDPGIYNPLGARALYIYQNGKDTLYRIHGSPKWASIGQYASSGCVRLINQDAIDLFGRVPPDTEIVVL